MSLDLYYDGQYLSEFGFVIGTVNGSGIDDILTDESQITFNTVQHEYGKYSGLASTSYESNISAQFTIVKDPCQYDAADLVITDTEYQAIARWLNRKQFLKCGFVDLDVDMRAAFYYASFNIAKNRIGNKIVGLDLTMTTNSPFSYGETYENTFTATSANTSFELENVSDEIGFEYPNVTVKVTQAGNLTITNETSGTETTIRNCSAGETITMKGKSRIITTDSSSHDLSSDFNYDWFALTSTYADCLNKFTVSLPCSVTLSYDPIIKSGY